MSRALAAIACVDVGSAAIKAIVRSGTGVVAGRAMRRRTAPDAIKTDVLACLADMDFDPAGSIRLCSTARASIAAGLLTLSRSFSGQSVARTMTAAGAATKYHALWHDMPKAIFPTVDLLVVAGGIGGYRSRDLTTALERLDPTLFPARHVAYAGHIDAVDMARRIWPAVIVIDNAATTGPARIDGALFNLARKLIVDDIVDAARTAELDAISEVEIRSTHHAVASAFEALSDGSPGTCALVDVGRATTGLHLRRSSMPPEFIVCPFGVGTLPSVVTRLSSIESIDLLQALYGSLHREAFASLQHGVMPDGLADKACLWLALKSVPDPTIVKGIETLFLTGGGAQAVSKGEAAMCLSAAGAQLCPRVVIDTEHTWWSEGLAMQRRRTQRRLEKTHG